MNTLIPASIQKALAIDPDPGSTWMDAEHIVILMQENRSFDHCFGQLRGVRGFNDPRAIHLPNGNPVWLTIKPGRRNLCTISSGYKRYEGNLDEFITAFLEKSGRMHEMMEDMISG